VTRLIAHVLHTFKRIILEVEFRNNNVWWSKKQSYISRCALHKQLPINVVTCWKAHHYMRESLLSIQYSNTKDNPQKSDPSGSSFFQRLYVMQPFYSRNKEWRVDYIVHRFMKIYLFYELVSTCYDRSSWL